METGVYWRYDLTADEQARFGGSSRAVESMDEISIDVLELLGMVISAWVLFCVSISPQRRVIVCCCGETTRQQCSGCDGAGGVSSRDPGL